MNSDELLTATGEILFFWDSGDEERHLLVTIEPDDINKPDAWELTGDLRDSVIATVEEGARFEVDYSLERIEMVDPDGATTFGTSRPRILAVRILGD